MKKVLVIVLVLAMLLCMTACGNQGKWVSATYLGYTSAGDYSGRTVCYVMLNGEKTWFFNSGDPEWEINSNIEICLADNGKIIDAR